MNDQYYFSRERFLKEEKDRKQIKIIGRTAGVCVVAYVLLQNLLTIPLLFEPLRSVYYGNTVFQNCVYILLSVFGLLLPFVLGGFYLRKKTRTEVFTFDKPTDGKLTAFAVLFGFFICLAGNYISSIFTYFMDNVGVELTAPEYEVGYSVFGRIVYFVMVAVVPPLTEELAVRGVIMQPLRKYGDRFAIVASAALFAILHGNLIQAPFAFIVGIGIGYAVCITGSLWTGVLIHFVNNSYSVITQFMIEDISDPARLNLAYNILMVVLYIITIIGSVLFFIRKSPRRLTPPCTTLSSQQKYGAFILNIPMLVAIAIMLYITSQYVNFTGR